MMRKQGFTITELMVGMLVSLMLLSAMAVFLGDAGYVFQKSKALVSDRTQLQQAMFSLSRELRYLEYGQYWDENDDKLVQSMLVTHNGEDEYFMNLFNDDLSNPVGCNFSFLRRLDDIEKANDQKSDPTTLNSTYQLYEYVVDTESVDPITKEAVNILRVNGHPILMGVSEFSIALGYDTDGDNNVSGDEWVYHLDEDNRETMLESATRLKITLARNTITSDGDTVENRLVRELLLRNRR